MLFLIVVCVLLVLFLIVNKRSTQVKVAPSKIKRFCRSVADQWISNEQQRIVFIGSGVGSLTCAGMLSLLGYPVLVLEMHSEIGGNLHTFTRKRGSLRWKWEVGLHYLGKPSGFTQRILNFLFSDSTLRDLWVPLPTLYDKACFFQNGSVTSTFDFRATYPQWSADLQTRFPHDIATIHLVLQRIQDASRYKRGYILKFLPYRVACLSYRLLALFKDDMQLTFAEFLDGTVANSELRNVFTAQFANYGFSPETCPFGFAASVIDHYCCNGAVYPRGGPNRLATLFANTILENGGEIWTKASVTQIVVDKGQVTGVWISGNKGKVEKFIPCKRVVCGANSFTLTQKLLPDEPHLTSLSKHLATSPLRPIVEYIFLFIGLDNTYALPRHNLWILPATSTKTFLPAYMENPLATQDGMPVFIASGSAKEDDVAGMGNSLVAITFAKSEWFADDYESQKEKFTERLLEVVKVQVPEIASHIVYTTLGTPQTYKKYLGTMQGEAYGAPMTPERYKSLHLFHPETEVTGLFRVGQDICTLGFTGALSSGLFTAVRLHGLRLLLKICFQNKPLQTDI